MKICDHGKLATICLRCRDIELTTLRAENARLTAELATANERITTIGDIQLCATCGGTGTLPGGTDEYPASACCRLGHAKECSCNLCQWLRAGYEKDQRITELEQQLKYANSPTDKGMPKRAYDAVCKQRDEVEEKLATANARIAALEAERDAADSSTVDFLNLLRGYAQDAPCNPNPDNSMDLICGACAIVSRIDEHLEQRSYARAIAIAAARAGKAGG